MPSTYRKFHETGPWWEMYCMKRRVFALELAGKDATFERHLLECWVKYPEYRDAVIPPDVERHFTDSADGTTGRFAGKEQEIIGLGGMPHPPQQPDFDVATSFETKHPGGRPQKAGDDVSRATEWRRRKEQGVLT
jgi:hypothetical protein